MGMRHWRLERQGHVPKSPRSRMVGAASARDTGHQESVPSLSMLTGF